MLKFCLKEYKLLRCLQLSRQPQQAQTGDSPERNAPSTTFHYSSYYMTLSFKEQLPYTKHCMFINSPSLHNNPMWRTLLSALLYKGENWGKTEVLWKRQSRFKPRQPDSRAGALYSLLTILQTPADSSRWFWSSFVVWPLPSHSFTKKHSDSFYIEN